MPTFDLTGTTGPSIPFTGNKVFRIKKRIVVPVTAVTNDVIKALYIKKGWNVEAVHVKIVTPSAGTTHTADVGITGGTADGFDAAIDLKGAAGTVTKTIPADTYAAAGGYYATADGTIDILMKSIVGLTAFATFDISARIIDLN